MDTQIEITQDNIAIAYINGRIDTINANQFEASLKKLLEDEIMDITIDCTNLNYISSSGLRVFLTLLKGVNAYKGKLTLKSLNSDILDIFNMTGFSSMFTII
ncbi:MAG: STAS domain-containing protein [Bacteroidales bacterium]